MRLTRRAPALREGHDPGGAPGRHGDHDASSWSRCSACSTRPSRRRRATRSGRTRSAKARPALHVMTRELRQANKVWTPGKTQIYVNIGDDTHVLYDCDIVHPTTRPSASAGAGRRRSGASCRSTSRAGRGRAAHAGRRLHVRAEPDQPDLREGPASRCRRRASAADGYDANLVLDDGFYLRNTDVG